jgi:TonB family protein
LIIGGLAVFLLGQDVERRPVVIEPPEPEKQVTEPPKAKPTMPLPRRIDLEPRLFFELPPDEPVVEMTEAERVKSRIDGYFEDALAYRRAKMGNVDPGWRYLEERMDYYFAPDFSMVGDPEVTEVSGAWLRKEFWNWLSGWYRNAQNTRANGLTPLEEDRLERIDTTLLDMQLAAVNDSDYGSTVTTVVEVSIDAQGGLDARLFTPSGSPRFDRAALETVRRAIAQPLKDELPPGPARSLYAISARYAILPPLPVIGFGFDIMLGYFEPFYPLKKMVRGQTRLVAVYRQKQAEK